MIVRQVELTSPVYGTMIVWIDAELPVKRGSTVIGKDSKKWEVIRVYDMCLSTSDIHSDWSVGGL